MPFLHYTDVGGLGSAIQTKGTTLFDELSVKIAVTVFAVAS